MSTNQKDDGATQAAEPTDKRSVARSTRVIAIALAAIVAGVLFLHGIARRPPRYAATATFVVDWKSMPSVPNDESADKLRELWRKKIVSQVTSLPQSDAALADVVPEPLGLFSTGEAKSIVIAKLRRWLTVRLVDHNEEIDRFELRTWDDDPALAQGEANCVLRGIVAKLNVESQIGGGVAALRSDENVEGITQKEDDLTEERRKLLDNYSRPFPDDVQERYDQIEAELNELEWKHAETGLSLLANLGKVFNDPVKAERDAAVEESRNGYILRTFLVAVLYGCAAGVLGGVAHRTLKVVAGRRKVPSGIPPIIASVERATSTPPPVPYQRAEPPLLESRVPPVIRP